MRSTEAPPLHGYKHVIGVDIQIRRVGGEAHPGRTPWMDAQMWPEEVGLQPGLELVYIMSLLLQAIG